MSAHAPGPTVRSRMAACSSLVRIPIARTLRGAALANPLVETKLYLPRLRRSLVARPRLSGRLLRGSDARLTLISAPAGFGKTTLLTAWLAAAATDNRSVAWLSLDHGDRQPATFWTYVITALQTAVPGVGADVLPLLQSAQPPIETVLTSVLNELSATPNDVVLVLDDYHLVDGPDLRDGMTFLLEHLPPHVHLVISSRADPLLPLARLRARGELVEVRAADLRFTPDEVAAYLNDVIGLDLAPDDIAALEGRTEGWIAALQLAAISMQGRTDIGGFIAQFAGNDRYIVDYLVEEVLQAQPDPVREFLLHTAVLDRLTGPLCDAVTGRDDGSQLLITLERANLFLVPLDDRREWYRYHHLFADVLRAHLLAEQPDLVPLLHQRASQWYERHDLTEEAVRHALAARGLRPRGLPDGAGRAGDPPSPAGSRAVRLAAGTARRRRPAQPGAQRLLRIHADGLRRPRGVRGPTRRRGTRVGRRTRRGDVPRGLTPRSSRRCRRPSPSTGPRSPRHEAMWQARRNTPGAPSIWPAPTTISRGAVRSGSSGSPPGRRAT